MPLRQRDLLQPSSQTALEFTSISKCQAPPCVEIEEMDHPEAYGGPGTTTPIPQTTTYTTTTTTQPFTSPSNPTSTANSSSCTNINNDNNEDDVSSTGICGANYSTSSLATSGGGMHRYASSSMGIPPLSPLSSVTPAVRHRSLPTLDVTTSRIPDGISLPHPLNNNSSSTHHQQCPMELSTSSQTSKSGFVSILRRNVSSPSTNVGSHCEQEESCVASLSNVSLGHALSPLSSSPFAAIHKEVDQHHHHQQQHRAHPHQQQQQYLGGSGSSFSGGPRLGSIPQSYHAGSDHRAEATTSINSEGSPKAALRLRQSLLDDRTLNREEDNHSCRSTSEVVSYNQSLGVGFSIGSSSGTSPNDDEWGDEDGTSEIHCIRPTIITTPTEGPRHHHHHTVSSAQAGGVLYPDSDDDDPLQLKGHFSVNGPPVLPSLHPLNVNSSSEDGIRHRNGGGNGGGPLVAEKSSSFDEASATASFNNNSNLKGGSSFSGMFTWDETRLGVEDIPSALRRSRQHGQGGTSPPLLLSHTEAGDGDGMPFRPTTTTMMIPPSITVNDGDQPPSFNNHTVVLTTTAPQQPFAPAMLSLSSPGNTSLQIQPRNDNDNDEEDSDDERVGSLSSALASRILRANEGGNLFRSTTSNPNTTVPTFNASTSTGDGGGGALGGSYTDNIPHLIDIHFSHSAHWAGGTSSVNSDIGSRLAQSMPAHTVPSSYSNSNSKSLSSRHQMTVGVPTSSNAHNHPQSYFSLSSSNSSHQQPRSGGYLANNATSPKGVVEICAHSSSSTVYHRPLSPANNIIPTVNTMSISSINTTVVSVQPSYSQDCSSSAYPTLLDRPLGDADDPLGVSIGSTSSSRRLYQQQSSSPRQLDSVTVLPVVASTTTVPCCNTNELSSSAGVSGSHQHMVAQSAQQDAVVSEEETTVVVVSPATKSVGVNSLSTDPDDTEYEEILRVQTMRMLDEGHDISDVEALKRRKRRLRRRIKVANSVWESSRAAVGSAPGTPSLTRGNEPRSTRRARATIVEVHDDNE